MKIALVGGCEVLYSRRRARKDGIDLEKVWTPGGSQPALRRRRRDALLERARAPPRRRESRLRVSVPRERAARRRRSQRSTSTRPSSAASTRASRRSRAGIRTAGSRGRARADDIATVSEKNRWVGFPYPKNMNAIMEVDQAAALVVMAASEADRLGIPPAQRVTFLGGGRSVDGWSVSERAFLAKSPAYAAAAARDEAPRRARARGRGPLRLLQLLPVRGRVRARRARPRADDPRGFTQTGGLAQHGGPGNAYSLHALANVVRGDAGPAEQRRLGIGARHDGDEARDLRALERPAAGRGVRRTRDAPSSFRPPRRTARRSSIARAAAPRSRATPCCSTAGTCRAEHLPAPARGRPPHASRTARRRPARSSACSSARAWACAVTSRRARATSRTSSSGPEPRPRRVSASRSVHARIRW